MSMYCVRCGASASVYWAVGEYLCQNCYDEAMQEEAYFLDEDDE